MDEKKIITSKNDQKKYFDTVFELSLWVSNMKKETVNTTLNESKLTMGRVIGIKVVVLLDVFCLDDLV